MSAIPNLKKKLKSVRATGKLSKAMKTVSAVKFNRLLTLWKNYSLYKEEYKFLYKNDDLINTDINDIVVIFGSSRGFCGGFNNDIVTYYFEEVLPNGEPKHLVVCGEEIYNILREKKVKIDSFFDFGEVPSYSECEPLFKLLVKLVRDKGRYIKMVFPKYKNTFFQIPTTEDLSYNEDVSKLDGDILWIPDKDTVFSSLYIKGFRATVFGAVIETALGAQASTLMTMRSAYDTAEQYGESLEKEIHRLRQSEVTSDVIETSLERGNQGDENNE